jgi:glucose-6-phosphate 1-epimerase
MSVTIAKDSKGRDEIVTLKTTDDSTSAQIRCFGATLVSWRVNETELIFVSPKANLHNEEQGKPVRGGIPIVFPQFGPGKMQQHGFARNLRWSLSKHGLDPIHGQPFVVFELEPTPYSQAMWPFSFRLLLHIAIRPATLITKLEVFNMEASSPFQFQALFHTYLEVGDVRKTLVRGLQGLHYTDNDGSINGKKQQLEGTYVPTHT